MVSPAETEVTIAGVDVENGVISGSGMVATTGAITRSRGASEWNSVLPI